MKKYAHARNVCVPECSHVSSRRVDAVVYVVALAFALSAHTQTHTHMHARLHGALHML